MKAFTAANEVLRFLLELCMLAAFAYWGSQAASSHRVGQLVRAALRAPPHAGSGEI